MLHFHPSHLELLLILGSRGIKPLTPINGLYKHLKHTAIPQLVINALESCVCDREKTKKRHVILLTFFFSLLSGTLNADWPLSPSLELPQDGEERQRCTGVMEGTVRLESACLIRITSSC